MTLQTLQAQITKIVDHLKHELTSLQIGRASTALVEDIQVESYGAQMPLKGVANISCPESTTIKIEPWDKSQVGVIEKAIQESNIGINPQNMGDSILLPIPPMTEERRKDLVKVVHEMAEGARIGVRNARQEAMKKVKNQKDNKEISEDQAKDLENDIQEEIDTWNKSIDEISKKKEEDVMTV